MITQSQTAEMQKCRQLEVYKEKLEKALQKVTKEHSILNRRLQLQRDSQIWDDVMTNFEWIKKQAILFDWVQNVSIVKLLIEECYDKNNRIPGERQKYNLEFVFGSKGIRQLHLSIKGDVCFHKLGTDGETQITLTHGKEQVSLSKMSTTLDELSIFANSLNLEAVELLYLVDNVHDIYLCGDNHIPVVFVVDDTSVWDQYAKGLIKNDLYVLK